VLLLAEVPITPQVSLQLATDTASAQAPLISVLIAAAAEALVLKQVLLIAVDEWAAMSQQEEKAAVLRAAMAILP